MKEIVLITGASSGIGKELAKIYAKNGKNLLLIARDITNLEKIKSAIKKENPKVEVYLLKKDLIEENAINEILEYIRKNNLKITTLINNAGIGDYIEFHNSNINKINDMICLNINVLTNLTYHILKDMKKEGTGSILNVSSIAAFMPGPLMGVYYASKAYVQSFTEALMVENPEIRIATLNPGPVRTGFEKKANVSFSTVKMMEPSYVAEYAYNKFTKTKQQIIIPGLANKIGIILAKISPRSIVRKMVYKVQTNFRKY